MKFSPYRFLTAFDRSQKLFGAVGRKFEKPPRCFRIELRLVSAEHPHVHDSQNLLGIALDDDPLRVPDGHDLLRQERDHKNWTLEENKPSNYKGPQYKSLNTVATSTKMI